MSRRNLQPPIYITKPYWQLVMVLLLFSSCTSQQVKIKPAYTPLTEAVYASVTIKPVDQYQAYASVSGILKKLFVEEGDAVKKGQPLFQIENDNTQINTENARLAYQLAQQNLQTNQSPLVELQKQIESARLQLANDSANYYRQKNLWENKIGTQSQLDQRLLAYQTAKRQLDILQSRYGQTANQLQTQLQQAKNALKGTINTSKDFTITSQLDGTVYNVYKEEGEIVLPQEPLAMLGRASKYLVELLVDEVDIARIRKGQKVLVRLDAYRDTVFRASITKIYPTMEKRSQTFTVEAVFDDPPQVLYPGLTGEANIVVAEKNKALTIPYEYLVNNNTVLTDSGEVKVNTGLKNFERVEILSGLDTSRFIYKPK